jgi:hypothetical protein
VIQLNQDYEMSVMKFTTLTLVLIKATILTDIFNFTFFHFLFFAFTVI